MEDSTGILIISKNEKYRLTGRTINLYPAELNCIKPLQLNRTSVTKRNMEIKSALRKAQTHGGA